MKLACRLMIVDADHQLGSWAGLTAQTLAAPVAPAVLAELGVPSRVPPLQLAGDAARLRDVLPALALQPGWRVRLALHEHQQLLVIVETRSGPAAAAGRAETAALLRHACIPAGGAGIPAERHRPALRTVVLVEDDPVVRTVCRRILQDRCLVAEAASAADALALADWLPWHADLLISDVNLPKMDGVTLAQEWLHDAPGARVLLLSGSFFPEIAASLPVVFLQKPFQADELLNCVELLLGDWAAVRA